MESVVSQLIENLDLSGEREVIGEFQAEKGHDWPCVFERLPLMFLRK